MMEKAIEDAFKRRDPPTETPISILECPDCHSIFKEVPRYVDHRIGEYVNGKLAEVQAPNPEKMVMDCKDGICKMIEETYDIRKKGAPPVAEETEEEPGLFSLDDDPEAE